MHDALLILLLLGACVWIGGYATLMVVSRVAAATLDPGARVEYFRVLGRRFGSFSTAGLALAYGCGLALAWPPSSWGGVRVATIVTAGVVTPVLAVAVRQARALTRRRRAALGRTDAGLAGHAARANALRAVLGLLSIAALALAVVGWS